MDELDVDELDVDELDVDELDVDELDVDELDVDELDVDELDVEMIGPEEVVVVAIVERTGGPVDVVDSSEVDGLGDICSDGDVAQPDRPSVTTSHQI